MPILIFLAAVLLLVLVPFGGIFALNLLGLTVPYTLSTWFGMFLLMLFFGSSSNVSR